MDTNPHLARVLQWEQASGGKNFPETIARVFAEVIEALTAILEQGEKQGVFIKTTPFIVHAMIVGSVMFYQGSQPIRSKFEAFPEALKTINKNLGGGIGAEIEQLIVRSIKRDDHV